MRRSIVVLALVLASASSAHAVPGDARLVQGVLEWPPKLTVEPFVIVRSEDGHWYYADVNGAKRLESSAITAGARVTVFGTEAARSHEITALAVSSGDAAALVLALMSHVSPTPATPAPSPSPTSPIESSRPPTPAVVAPMSKSVAKAPVTSSPQPHKEKVTAPKTMPPSEPSPPSVTAPARPASTSRWSEVRGAVHSVAGQELVVRADDGQLVAVDLSGLRGAAVSLTPGAPIVVYGMLSDEKFQAIGLIQQETRSPGKPVAAPPRR